MLCQIEDIAFNFPSKKKSLPEMAKKLGLSILEEKMFDRFYGLKNFPIDDSQDLVELIEPVFKYLFNRHSHLKRTLKLVLHCHTLPTVSVFDNSIIETIANRLFPPETEIAGLAMAHCATGLSALSLISQSILPGEYGIILISEKAFHRWVQLIPNITIMGEASCAVLITRNGKGAEVLGSETTQDGRFSLNSGHPPENPETLKLFQNSYFELTENHLLNSFKKWGISFEDITYIFPHNVNVSSWYKVAKNLNIPKKMIYLNNVAQFGHCFGSDPFISLKMCMDNNSISKGDLVVLVCVGLGATISSILLRI